MFQRCDAGDGVLAGAIFVGAASAATEPVHAASFSTGRCRGQKTPPTEPATGSDRRAGGASLGASIVGAALAATGPMKSAVLGTGCRRGQRTPPTEARSGLRPQVLLSPCASGLGRDRADEICSSRHRPLSGSEDPSHRSSVRAQAAGLAQHLWERPWPRQGRCNLQFSAQAAVGVRGPLLQNLDPGSGRRSGSAPVGAALAATGPMKSAVLGTSCRRGQRTPPTRPWSRLRPQILLSPCGRFYVPTQAFSCCFGT